MTKRLLVVDWDYFFPIVETVYDTPDTDRGQWEWMLYDWGHSEQRMADYFQNHAWVTRAASFVKNDLPLPGTSGAEATFWKRFRLAPDATVFVADSNSQAAHPMVAHGVTGGVWLYDAHHDSGYRKTALDDMVKAKYVTCEDWMLAYHGWGVKRLHVRYPAWRTVAFEVEPEPAIPVDRAFDDGQPVPLTFHRVFICRSGSWTPPWLDPAFEAFVAACPVRAPARWLDDMTVIRPWGDDLVTAEVARQAEIDAMLKAHAETQKAAQP